MCVGTWVHSSLVAVLTVKMQAEYGFTHQRPEYEQKVAKDLGCKLVGIAGGDICNSNKKLILAIVWQLMRAYTIKLLTDLGGGNKKIEDKQIVSWVRFVRLLCFAHLVATCSRTARCVISCHFWYNTLGQQARCGGWQRLQNAVFQVKIVVKLEVLPRPVCVH